jgi:hypothetical protein
MLPAQADVTAATPTTIVGAFIFVAVSLVLLIGWILKHLFMTTIPGVLADAKEQRECHERTVDAIVSSARTEQAAERALCEKRAALTDAAVAALTTATSRASDEMTRAINDHTTEQATKYRHDLYDAINRAVLTRDLYIAQKAADQKAVEERVAAEQKAEDEAERRR